MFRRILLLFIGLGLALSDFYSLASNAQSDVPADTVITLERTICYGSCPMYKLTIKADGAIEFLPKHVKDREIVSGEIHRSNVTQKQLRQLIIEFNKAKYFSLNDKYSVI